MRQFILGLILTLGFSGAVMATNVTFINNTGSANLKVDYKYGTRDESNGNLVFGTLATQTVSGLFVTITAPGGNNIINIVGARVEDGVGGVLNTSDYTISGIGILSSFNQDNIGFSFNIVSGMSFVILNKVSI